MVNKDNYVTIREFENNFKLLYQEVQEIKNNHFAHLQRSENNLTKLIFLVVLLSILSTLNLGVGILRYIIPLLK